MENATPPFSTVSTLSDPTPTESGMEGPVAVASDQGNWEWGNLLDFSIDEEDQLILPWESEEIGFVPPVVDPNPEPEPSSSGSSRVRKRDARLVCENFLAGRVPCACPEVDEKEEEEAMAELRADGASGGERKKARGGGGRTGTVRCQVPGCEVDISELKGYHRRHRVCLKCANAVSVLLDGEMKRYCQQCGKFHILTDFDEGKRSCRRKLERHNKRRRRRPNEHKDLMGKENEFSDNMQADDVVYDEEQAKESLNEISHGSDCLHLSNKTVDGHILPESQEHGSPFCSDPNVQIGCSYKISSFTVSSETQVEERRDNPITTISSSISENKSTYSTTCPTGRISFKLYDWNPAEFPRRLRHQIFEWLSNMPVELEGYVRPGCTILTIFLAVPHSMWKKLNKDAIQYLHDFVKKPDNLLSGRGNVHIYLNNTIFQVLRDGNSLVNVKMEIQAPKLHYVHPILFEAGKPMEFVACGSNLFQPKFRFLISFAGKYLLHELDKMRFGIEEKLSEDCEHQMLRIRVPQTKPELFGPAFIEVENESGLSNFIPILLANKHVCSELERIQQSCSLDLDMPHATDSDVSFPCLHKVSMSMQSSTSQLFMDVAWLLKEPQLDGCEAFFSIGNIQRLNCLLRYLVQNRCVNILKKVLYHVETLTNGKKLDDLVNGNHDEMKLFEMYVDDANKIIYQKFQHGEISDLDPQKLKDIGVPLETRNAKDDLLHTSRMDQMGEIKTRGEATLSTDPVSQDREEEMPLLAKTISSREVLLPVKLPLEACDHVFYRTITNTRFAIYALASIVVCFGFCIALFHPHKAGEFAVSVRRCVFGTTKL